MGVAIAPDGRTVVSGSDDKTLKVWDLETGRCRATFEGHTNSVFGVAITSDGKTVVSGSDDKTLKVWDLETGRCRATFEGHTDSVFGVAITPDGRTVVSGSADKTLKVWDLDQLMQLNQPLTPSVAYASAKIVLVGDTGVGKSGLAERLICGKFVPILRRYAYYCSNDKCRNPFEDRVVKARLKDHKRYLILPHLRIKEPSGRSACAANCCGKKGGKADRQQCQSRTPENYSFMGD